MLRIVVDGWGGHAGDGVRAHRSLGEDQQPRTLLVFIESDSGRKKSSTVSLDPLIPFYYSSLV